MEQLVNSLPQFADLIQKAGVVGILLIVCAVLVREVLRLRQELGALFKERDAYRLHYAFYKAACDNANVKVDTSALLPLPGLLPAPP